MFSRDIPISYQPSQVFWPTVNVYKSYQSSINRSVPFKKSRITFQQIMIESTKMRALAYMGLGKYQGGQTDEA